MIDQDIARIRALHDVLPADEVVHRYIALADRQPDEPAVYQSLALFLMLKGEYDAAIEVIDNALSLRPDPLSFFIRGRACDETLDFAGAIEAYRACLALDESNAKAKFYLSLAYLSVGDFSDGTALYSYRLSPERAARYAGIPQWSPDKPGGRVLLWAEQGIGDEIMFLQLLHLAVKLDFAFTVECDRRLIAILRANFPTVSFVDRTTPADPAAFDYQMPVGDLLAVFHQPLLAGAVPRPSLAPVPHPAVAARAAQVKADRRLIGLSWLSTNEDYGARRSVMVETLCRRLDPARHAIAVLQYLAPEPELEKLRARGFTYIAEFDCFNDVEAVFALVAACDAIVSIDNSVAHFAGAVGVETHLLLPQLPNWRWGVSGEETYWYPSVHLHCRAADQSWGDVVDAIPLT
jgi:tetratricopeptide (TPR) repeat protein